MRILILSLWLLTGLTTGVIASDKGHGFGSWFFAGLLLGPLGLVAAAGLSDQKLREYIRRTIEPQPITPIRNSQQLLSQNNLYDNSIPKLLNESQNNLNLQTQEDSKSKYIGDFLLHKTASEDQLWMKILEILDFCRPELVAMADRTQSNANLSLTGGRVYIICTSDRQKLALAYAKESSSDGTLYWQLRMY